MPLRSIYGRIVATATAIAALSLAAGLAATPAAASGDFSSPFAQEPISPLPLTVAADPERARLGERLFRDPSLSGDRSRSCASCHPLEGAGMDGNARAPALNNLKLLRNTPAIFNLRFDLFYNWDGSTEVLTSHDEKVLLNPALMAMSWEQLLPRLRADGAYADAFARCYPQGLSSDSVLDALATFELSMVTPNARFDRYLRGDSTALTPAEQAGYQLFKSYGCVACHQGVNVGGNLLQKFGVFADTAPDRQPGDEIDLGHFMVTHDPLDREVFRVPSLRNVAMTAPYFHDGRAPTLELAVSTMARVQLGRPVTTGDIRLIVQFLGTLTGEYRGRPVGHASGATPP